MKEAIHTQQVVLSFPWVKEATLPWQLLTFLLVKEAIHPQHVVSLALSFPLGKEAVLPRQLLTFPWVKEAALSRPLLTPLAKVTVLPRQVNQAIKLGQSGKALGSLPGIAHPRLPRRIVLSPGKTTSPLPPSKLPQGSSNEEPNPKWVINLSNKPLKPAQRSVLAKGPNFAVTTRQPPNLEYITAIEAACTKLSQQDAEELRADINRVLRSSQPTKLNLTKEQNLALRELKRDRDCIVLSADKGVAMVIMNRQDYINKANQLLNQNTYRSIAKDPTSSIKNKLINILKRVKNQTGLDSNRYKSIYSTGCVPPKFYGPPKIHKPDTPLRPIVSSCGSVTYSVAKGLAKSSNHWLASPHTTSPAPKTLWNKPGRSNWNLENVSVPMMCLPCSSQSQ